MNNAHFLAALNLAEYAMVRHSTTTTTTTRPHLPSLTPTPACLQHRGRRCPILFAISDNDICISLRGYGWLRRFLKKTSAKVFHANGNSAADVYRQTEAAASYVRDTKRPGIVVYVSRATRKQQQLGNNN